VVGPFFWRLGLASDAALFSGTLPALLSEDMGAGIGMASLEAAVSHAVSLCMRPHITSQSWRRTRSAYITGEGKIDKSYQIK